MQYEGQNSAWGPAYVRYMLQLYFAVALKQRCQTQIHKEGGGGGGGGPKLGQNLLKMKNNVFKDAYKMFNVVIPN